MKRHALTIAGILAVYLIIMVWGAAANFARNGGNAYLMSPHSQVDINGPNGGTVVSVVGRENTVDMEPPPVPQPESRIRQIGTLIMVALWSGLFMVLSGGLIVLLLAKGYGKGRLIDVN